MSISPKLGPLAVPLGGGSSSTTEGSAIGIGVSVGNVNGVTSALPLRSKSGTSASAFAPRGQIPAAVQPPVVLISTDPVPRAFGAGVLQAVLGNAAKSQAILAERKDVQWTAASTPLTKLQHKLEGFAGRRGDTEKLAAFVLFVANGDSRSPLGVRQDLGGGWARFSRRSGERVATLDLRFDTAGAIADVRSPAQAPGGAAAAPTWRHPTLMRSTESERANLENAVKTMLTNFDGNTVWLGLTAAQHADRAWQSARRTASAAGKADPRLGAVALEDRIAVTLFTRRAHAAVNSALGSGDPVRTAAVTPYTNVLRSGLNQLSPNPGTPLFRGMNIPEPMALARFLAEYGLGKTVTEPRFWTASSNRLVAQAFEGNIRISFVGTITAKPLGALAHSAVHAQSVYPAGTQFRVIKYEEPTKNAHYYHLTLQDLGQPVP